MHKTIFHINLSVVFCLVRSGVFSVFFSKSNVKYMLCISVNYPKEATGEQDLRLEEKKSAKTLWKH